MLIFNLGMKVQWLLLERNTVLEENMQFIHRRSGFKMIITHTSELSQYLIHGIVVKIK